MPRLPRLEALEDRCVPAPVNLSASEQLLVELLNRARANPAAEATRYNVGLNDGIPGATITSTPKMPLAPNQLLTNAARSHSADMIARDYFAHDTPEGITPFQRVTAAGYNATIVAENLASFSTSASQATPPVGLIHEGLFKSPEHRINILANDVLEIGIGFGTKTTALQQYKTTEKFGTQPNSANFLTGVLYKDSDGDKFYSLGEGLGNVTIAAKNLDNNQVFTETTGAAGGYALPLAAGRYSVTIQGLTGTVNVNGANVKVDYRTNAAGGSPELLGVAETPPSPPPPSPPPPPSIPGSVTPDKVGLFRDGIWHLDTNNNRILDVGEPSFPFGMPTDRPVTGDWNGDGSTDVGVFRNVNGVGQFILDSNGNRQADAADDTFFFGVANDTLVIGDWNGDGKSKVGVYRDNGAGVGVFSLDTNGNRGFDGGDDVFLFGAATDRIVIGDWNNNGRDKVGVYRDNGAGVAVWSTDKNGTRGFDAGDDVFLFGIATDTIVIGDWNGDGRSKAGVLRDNGSGAAVWSLDSNGNLGFEPADLVFTFGLASDKPVIGKWK